MPDSFPVALRFTLSEECGHNPRNPLGNVDNPKDPGGRTSRGVTQAVYDASCVAAKWPTGDVWLAPQERIISIYRARYWRKVGADFLAWPLALVVFDTGVLHGTGRAREWLAACPTWQAYVARREASYEAIIRARPTSEEFRAGWMGRCTRLRAACLAAAAPIAASRAA